MRAGRVGEEKQRGEEALERGKGGTADIVSALGAGLKCWLQWPAAIGVVSVENYLCSIILMAVSNCIIPEQQVALAAGVIALTASPHWPRGSGQALTTAPANLLLCSIADQGPESSVMPSGSALSVGRRGDLHRCLSLS
ncbi:hypothetical protein JOQ06_006083 [Pogonophryne albipinna]|uniref:Uncharacterized protein n=1 Tax=Pogonophryne albipinna TaxID=1090488 RepID=A0AAD6FSA3_9TELE|nr:hypothetical protein JOQ06_006083 [Pogonophryne albipinna]